MSGMSAISGILPVMPVTPVSSVAPVSSAGGARAAGGASQAESAAGAGGFSQILAQALERELQEQSVMLTASDGAADTRGQDASQAELMGLITGAAASGEAGDAEIALFMLCLMMQENQDSEFAPLLGAMAAMLENIKGDTGAVRTNVMQSGYHPYILSTIDAEVFRTADTVMLPAEAWKKTMPALTGTEANRNADNLRRIIDQFQVETAERYRPYRRGSDTYCNIFLWDVTSALGAEIPHYVDPGTGAPRAYPDVKGARELNAAGVQDWLVHHGQAYGWREVRAEEAQYYANMGRPAVTTWVSGSQSHNQVVCPSGDGGYNPARGVSVAQAGSRNTGYTYASSIYNQADLKNVRYFVHA